jgi:DNA repair protein RAD50
LEKIATIQITFLIDLLTFFLAVKRQEALNNEPRRNDIPTEIRREEDKIDNLKRQIEDDRMALDTLRHSAEAQNTVTVLKNQCTKDLESLQESMRDHSYELQKYNLQPAGLLPGADGGDDNGDQLIDLMKTLGDDVKDKCDVAETELSRVQEALDTAQQTVSEKTYSLRSRQQSAATLRTKLDAFKGDNSPVAKVSRVVDELRQHNMDAVVNLPADDPREILKYLDEQLQEIEENDPSSIGTPAVVRKVLIRLKKLVSTTLLLI